jgi:hypothetical protein
MEPIKDLEFVTSVDLGIYVSKSKKKPFHFVYGSQLYETLFGVFAKFDVEDDKQGTYLIKGVSLRIFNYKGPINIGFTSNKLYLDVLQENLYFAVRGTSRKVRAKLKFSTPIVVKEGKRLPLTFNRILYPLPGFEFNIRERNTRNLRSRSKKSIPQRPLFDPEFQYRSGVDYFDHALKPGMLGFEDIDMERVKDHTMFPSLRCSQSKVNLFH